MNELYIFGAGEFAKIASSYFSDEGVYDIKGFVVDDEHFNDSCKSINAFPIFKFSEVFERFKSSEVRVFVAISASRMNLDRANVYERLKKLGCQFASYVSPKAFVSSKATLGENVFVFEENVIQNDVEIGDNTILWSGNHVGHQSKIGSHVFLSSHVVISGFCTIERYCYFGVNSTLVDHLFISQGTLVGAGSLILKDTEQNSVYVGNPAKKIDGKDPFKVNFR